MVFMMSKKWDEELQLPSQSISELLALNQLSAFAETE